MGTGASPSSVKMGHTWAGRAGVPDGFPVAPDGRSTASHVQCLPVCGGAAVQPARRPLPGGRGGQAAGHGPAGEAGGTGPQARRRFSAFTPCESPWEQTPSDGTSSPSWNTCSWEAVLGRREVESSRLRHVLAITHGGLRSF